ncbi:MAG: hypothetical protein K9G41_02005 [Flavobacteriales bacterium]|nr:hypothetical protein [Flavobacteriales bacterium]
MSKRAVQYFLGLLIVVFGFNLMAEIAHKHNDLDSAYYFESSEAKEKAETEVASRFKNFDPAIWILFDQYFHYSLASKTVSELSGRLNIQSRAFFPHSLHVPIFLDKCVFLI